MPFLHVRHALIVRFPNITYASFLPADQETVAKFEAKQGQGTLNQLSMLSLGGLFSSPRGDIPSGH